MSRVRHSIAASLGLSLSLLISVEANALSTDHNAGQNEKPPEANVQLDANNSGDSTKFTGDKQVTINSPSSEDGNPSPNSPTIQASDPSMWEEQPHRDCSTEKDENGLSKYACNLASLGRPSQPQEDAPTSSGPRTITITTREAATLIAQGSGITRQPPGAQVIISKAFIVYTNPNPPLPDHHHPGHHRRGRVHPHLLHLELGRQHHPDHHRPRPPLPPPNRHPPLPAHRQKHHHHPDHHLDHPLPPRRRPELAHHRRHHHHHRDLHPLRPRPHHLLPHRRRRRSPRPLTRSPSAASFQTVRSVPLPQVQARHVT